jgi:hypothetical protein
MNDTVGENYIAVKGRDTLRKIVVVSPRVVLTECEYKELGWRYELWPTEPTETWLNFSYSDERLKDVNSKMLLMSNLLRVQLENNMRGDSRRLLRL